jgi:4-diphosphocytidyl-2-C-methyl-D-erythritol kinase
VARRAQTSQLAAALIEPAFAKVNLTLRVLGRRADGYHSLESLVCFASVSDRVELRIGLPLELRVSGPMAEESGPVTDNLILRAARGLESRVKKLKLGRFGLVKRLPVGAGLGGGSSDAAAALRLLARANGMRSSDPRLHEVARSIGSDVSVCLDMQARWMRGRGEILSDPVAMPKLFAVLVFPTIPLATAHVYGKLVPPAKLERTRTDAPATPTTRKEFVEFISARINDLQPAAIRLAPIIDDVLAALRDQPACVLARMTGSGAACFGIFAGRSAALLASRRLAIEHTSWWVRNVELGAAPL